MIINVYQYIFDNMIKLSNEIRQIIVENLMSNPNQSKLTREFSIARTTIQSVWKKYLKTGFIKDIPRSGRPNKTTEMEQHHLIIYFMKF